MADSLSPARRPRQAIREYPDRGRGRNDYLRRIRISTPIGCGKVRMTDITYLKTAAGWVYLAVVLDLFSRKVVGWSIGDSLETTLVSAALHDAIKKRSPKRGQLLHHSDRGCQYTSNDYQKALRTLKIEVSMSRSGNCYDNAVIERFFWSLKHEWTNHRSYANRDDARLSVFRYVETFYNPRRRHQTLGYKSPNQFEAEHAPAQAA